MPATRLKIFISSVQKELAEERHAVKDFITHDPLLSRFISDVFLFENIPAGDRKPDDIYLGEVEQCDIYLAILGNKYGWKNEDGKSPTELEFEHATITHRERLVFVKGNDDNAREVDMAKLVSRASRQVTRRRFSDISGLVREVYASLVECLENRGMIISTPFDDSVCDRATLRDIDNTEVKNFVETAEAAGRLKFKGSRTPKTVLKNFNLLRDGRPTNAAMLLFGKSPHRFFNNAQVHCFHFHGTEKRKPIASQKPYEGRLLEVIDQAVEFVLGKIDRRVGTRATSIQAPVEFEIPIPVITEAIVNAVAHRNYRNNGFIQVIVFMDRIEVWNPGELPPGLTPELLRKPHGPIPQNPLIAEPLFRVKYVEKAGTGTTDMIADCQKAGLPEPDFEQRGPHFVVILWRDWLTSRILAELNLSKRQQQAITYLKANRVITNSIYQEQYEVSKRTASRDLNDLMKKGVLKKIGTTGKGVQYRLIKGAIKGPKGPKGYR
ncbi:MAG: ATP-dependent DNA helicase RecG [Desulfobacteraceae bacterium Eth-SRB1]|nr:MAG: ATP-dependent DNA helicase RecG [Desulfobacteraceae bacterium Eth-SRB1]